MQRSIEPDDDMEDSTIECPENLTNVTTMMYEFRSYFAVVLGFI